MELILQNTDRIEMSMSEFIDFTKYVVGEAIAAKLINPDKGNGNQKCRVKTREVIEAYKIIDKL